MKRLRILSLVLSVLMAASMLTACDTPPSQTETKGTTESKQDRPPPDDTAEQTTAETEAPDDRFINTEFSIPGGFYSGSQMLTLVLPEKAPAGATIRYTLDGNEPTVKSAKYTDGIQILAQEESVCVRAACYSRSGELLGRIVTNTYIKCANDRFDNVVVSIVTDENNLYGSRGIIDNPTQSGKEWERPCHVEMFKGNGEEIISQDAGLRIYGGSSRTLPQKSFRLVARKDGYYDETKYNGQGSFDYPFFESRKVQAGVDTGKVLVRYDRLVLRNGGNDSLQHGAQDRLSPTLLRDQVANNFTLKYASAVPAQHSKFVTVYLNGQYYGILDMKEDINDDYFANIYGIENKNAITVVKSELDTKRKCEIHNDGEECRFCGTWFYYEVDNGNESELSDLEAIYNMVTQFAPGEQESVYSQLSEKLDLENFMQYMAMNLFLANNDWPHNNVRLWKYSGSPVEGNPYTDGKWRFTMRDTDFSFGRYSSGNPPELYTLADSDSFNFALGSFYGKYKYYADYGDPLYLKSILNFCLKNAQFKSDFEAYCLSLVSSDATRDLTRMMANSQAAITGEMPYHLSRWSGTISPELTFDRWNASCTVMKRWTDPRRQHFTNYLNECLSNY